ncbi:aldo/keto reductase [candidate division KSB1 bacterium]|nr:aldo/keto reductase [candidate division KSB1 bacterium]
MIYRSFGSTGKKVSAIGFGGMRFADQNDAEACAALITAAYQKGINYFDTAPGYGKSEELFGAAFKEMKKQRKQKPFYVATKTVKSSPSEIREEIERSLRRMDLDAIDFYHVWCVLSMDGLRERIKNGALKEFERLKNEGLIRHICISTHMQGKEISQAFEEYPFEGILLGYSAMNFAYRDEGLTAAAKHDCGVVVMNPLGGGIIPQYSQRFSFVKTTSDESAVEGALRFLINDPRIAISLVGFSNQAQLEEAIRAVDGYQPIPTETIAHIRESMNEAFNSLCTGCGYCDSCPEEIPVPKLMEAYNHFMLSEDPQAMLNRLRWHWGIQLDSETLRKCTRCGTCEAACTQKLPITDRLQKMRELADTFLAKNKS